MVELPLKLRLPNSGLYYFPPSERNLSLFRPLVGNFCFYSSKGDALNFLIVLLSVQSSQPPGKSRTRPAACVTHSLLRLWGWVGGATGHLPSPETELWGRISRVS